MHTQRWTDQRWTKIQTVRDVATTNQHAVIDTRVLMDEVSGRYLHTTWLDSRNTLKSLIFEEDPEYFVSALS